MIYELIDNDTGEIYGNFKTNKNASSKTILKKMKTGKKDLFYICFGIMKNIRLEKVEK